MFVKTRTKRSEPQIKKENQRARITLEIVKLQV